MDEPHRVDEELVRSLLTSQHPDLADRRLELVNRGWDNAIFRLGDDLAVRLPMCEMSAPLVENEQTWLAGLATNLTVPVPVPVRRGFPGHGYRWSWSIVPWLKGSVVTEPAASIQPSMALDLAGFLASLHRTAPEGFPENRWRGGPLLERDERQRERLERITPRLVEAGLDPAKLADAWTEAIETEPWGGPPIWLHGDLHPLNVLWDRGRLSAVIDFGDITAGDPATDLMVAWYLFDGDARQRFREHLERLDTSFAAAVWARGRGWALTHAVAVLGSDFGIADLERVAHRALVAVCGRGLGQVE